MLRRKEAGSSAKESLVKIYALVVFDSYNSKYNSIGRTYFSQYLQIGSRRPDGALKICGLVVLQVPRVVVSLIGTDALNHLLVGYIYPNLFILVIICCHSITTSLSPRA